MKQWIKEVAKGKRGAKDLSYEDSYSVAQLIAQGKATDVQISAFLIAERMKSESHQELLAFIHAFREASERLTLPKEIQSKLIDFAGPYSGRNSFLSSIPIALLLSDQGIPVYLHSSRPLPPKYGSTTFSVLEGLSIKVDGDTKHIEKSIKDINIGFGCTDKLCPPLAQVRHIREELGVRTMLNTIDKLLNLACAKNLIFGAFHRTAIEIIAPLFDNENLDSIYIAQGIEGSEDLALHKNSFLFSKEAKALQSTIIKPKEYGFDYSQEQFKKVLSLNEQIELINSILSGDERKEFSYYRDQIIFNTAIRYWLLHEVNTIGDGISLANNQLKRGAGMKKLKEWQTISQ